MNIKEDYKFFYNHIYSINPSYFHNNKILSQLTPIFIKKTNYGDFVTYLEHSKFPIFLSQFHPEKIIKVKASLKNEALHFSSMIVNVLKRLIIENNELKNIITKPLEE